MENHSSNILTLNDKESDPIQENEGANADSDYNDDSFVPLSSEIEDNVDNVDTGIYDGDRDRGDNNLFSQRSIQENEGANADSDYKDDSFDPLSSEIEDNVDTGIDDVDTGIDDGDDRGREDNNLFLKDQFKKIFKLQKVYIRLTLY